MKFSYNSSDKENCNGAVLQSVLSERSHLQPLDYSTIIISLYCSHAHPIQFINVAIRAIIFPLPWSPPLLSTIPLRRITSCNYPIFTPGMYTHLTH